MKRLIASLSLDLDDKWTYMKTHGDTSWQTFPSYLEIVVPRVLNFLEEQNLKITFFIVAQDTAFEKNRTILKMITDAGHSVGNHSFNHDPWLHTYSENEIYLEIEKAHKAIADVTGQEPIGFRGPGFSYSPYTLNVLLRQGYVYDATSLPSFLTPLARAYFLKTANFTKEELEQRKGLFGKFTDGFRTQKAHFLNTAKGKILEIPVTTMPILKTPFHSSYIHYLGLYSKGLGLAYFKSALNLCRITGTQPSILLHPLDFLGNDDFDELSFFPAMRVPSNIKLDLMARMFQILKDKFELVPLNEHARILGKSDILKTATMKS